MIKITAAIVAFVAALYAAHRIVMTTLASNRRVEMDENEKSGSLTEAQMHWTIIHIRDDIGVMHNLLVLAIALLAAILAVLLF